MISTYFKILVVGQTTKHMTHGSSCDVPSCDMFNLGSSYFHVALTTVRHLLTVNSQTGCNSICTALTKVAPLEHIPKGVLVNSKSPNSQMKAVNHRSSSLTGV